jgi:hypothetical protein
MGAVRAAIAVLARGGPVMIPLAACSVLALAMILERALVWWRLGRGRDPELVLAQRVRRLLQGNPALAIVINADGDASHRDVVAVLDALRLAGASRMAIAVTPASQAR